MNGDLTTWQKSANEPDTQGGALDTQGVFWHSFVGAFSTRFALRCESGPARGGSSPEPGATPLGLGMWRAFGRDLGLTPPGYTMSPRWGLGCGGRLVGTWGSRHQAIRCRPVGAWDVAGVWSGPGAHATRLYDVAPLGLGMWRAFGRDLGLTPPGYTMSPRWGLGCGGPLVRTWGSRHQAIRCRPVGAWDVAGVWSGPGAHATNPDVRDVGSFP